MYSRPPKCACTRCLQPVELDRVADRDELRRRLRQPGEQVADRVHLQVLERRVRLRGGRVLGDVELVVDVAVERVALRLDGRDRLARELERDRLVPQPLAR